MRFGFKDIYSEALYKDCYAVFVVGPYGVFNNIVIDKFRALCEASQVVTDNLGIMEAFEDDNDSQEVSISNTLELNDFMVQVATPAIDGKWFCSVNLATLNKKQLNWVTNYIKDPSKNGVLCLWGMEFRDYKNWLSNKSLLTGLHTHLISLSFPYKTYLEEIVKDLFQAHHVSISPKALDLFIVRMSNSYDDYTRVIDKICTENLPNGYMTMDPEDLPEISYEMALRSLKGIENFVVEDFLDFLTEPLGSDVPSGRKKIYRIMGYLLEEYGARKLVSVLKSRIDDIIEFRVAINKGYIPIMVNYNIEESKKLLGPDSPIAKKSDFQFKRLAQTASRTSLTDWVLMKLILSNVDKLNDNSYVKAIYALTSRSVLQVPMVNEAIGYDDTFDDELTFLDEIMYMDAEEFSEAVKAVNSVLKPEENIS